MGGLATDSDKRRAFWTRYQPGTRAARAPLGSDAFFGDVEARRYALEPDIPEMVYHRDSLNYYVSIMAVRRALAGLLLLPAGERLAARLTGEPRDVLRGHRELLARHGLRYLADPALFLSHNTDGPGNPLSKVYSRAGMRRAFAAFEHVDTDVRFLNLRAYPLGERLERMATAQRLGRRAGWHLWVTARK